MAACVLSLLGLWVNNEKPTAAPAPQCFLAKPWKGMTQVGAWQYGTALQDLRASGNDALRSCSASPSCTGGGLAGTRAA